MVFRIKITYPENKMRENGLRAEARNRFEVYDRVPAMAWLDARFPLHARGVTFKEYFRSPKAHVYHQLHNAKWLAENIRDDRVTGLYPETPSPGWWTAPYWSIRVSVHWGTLTAGGFGAPIRWLENAPPRTLPLIHDVEDIDKLEIPEPTENLFGKTIEWYHEIYRIVKNDFEVIFNGEKVDVEVGLPWPEQFSAAIDLAGWKFYGWLYRYPDACHKLLRKITEACIKWGKYVKGLTGKQMSLGGDGDAAGHLSVRMFREFVIPYIEKLYSLTPGDRPFHNDGDITHLLDCLFNELKITYFNGVGWKLDPKVLRDKTEKLGRKVYLTGNVDPILVYNGPIDQIIQAARYCLENLASFGGYLLCDGCNVPPGTPLEHIEALRIASERYGKGLKQ